MKLTAAIFLLLLVSVYCSAQTPNIVFILTDDQDTEIGGMVSSCSVLEICPEGTAVANMI